MGVRITIDYTRLTISGADNKLLNVLRAVSSYKVEGYYWAPSYKAGHWDGKEHLLKQDRRTRDWTAPIGLLDDYMLALKARDIKPEVVDLRRIVIPANIGWDGTQLRRYQLRAISRILKPGYNSGIGIINMPIRSGKTKTAAGLIARLKCRTLFVVPSKLLLKQTREALAETLQIEVGQLGDGEYTLRDVTVCTIQTLSLLKRTNPSKAAGEAKERWRKLKAPEPERPPLKEYVAAAREKAKEMKALWERLTTYFSLLIMDECHHLTADDWRKAMMEIKARYRVGLSATAFPELGKEIERGVIWLKACCGPVRIRVSMDKLIEQGHMLGARVLWVPVTQPNRNGAGWSQKLKEECILRNEHRNRLAMLYAQRFATEGKRVLVVTNRHSQVDALLSVARDIGVACDYMVGSDSKQYGLKADTSKGQSLKVAALIRREPAVLIGTVLGEGVDIPEVEVVINAEGGADMKATIQRMRNLTGSDGKTEAIFVDFNDLTSKYFKKHSRARLKVYKSVGGFTIEEVKDAA